MSTRGSFIVRRDNEDKELYIPHDAYPRGAGKEIIRLIREREISKLFNLLVSEDEAELKDDYGHDYSLEKCEYCIENDEVYIYTRGGRYILDSLMCEYAYALDLDSDTLEYYVGFQKTPQAGNRYGTIEINGYFPCCLKAVFSFAYLSQANIPDVVDLMESLERENSTEIHRYDADPNIPVPVKKKEDEIRQLIIARKDLYMSPGKLAAQISHASMAFLSDMLRKGKTTEKHSVDDNEMEGYEITISVPSDIYRDWLHGNFTKTICEARNRKHLVKSISLAEELGLQEGKDFFLIRDACLTELMPEETDEGSVGRSLTCIGFRPLPDSVAHRISRKYQLYR